MNDIANSMSQKDKYVAFKNYMFNELGIGANEIQAIVKETVREEIKHMIAQGNGKFDPFLYVKP